jgi:hypothetical protein
VCGRARARASVQAGRGLSASQCRGDGCAAVVVERRAAEVVFELDVL